MQTILETIFYWVRTEPLDSPVTWRGVLRLTAHLADQYGYRELRNQIRECVGLRP